MELSIAPRLRSTLLKKRYERSKLSYLGAAGISERLGHPVFKRDDARR